MAEIIPFRGILYNPAKVSGDAVTAPPYDIITPEFKDALYSKSPFNIIRIDFGKEFPDDNEKNNKYTRAREFLDSWLKDGILIQDKETCFYSYQIDYSANGDGKKLIGIFAMVKIEELGKGIYPHEATHSKPKADRLNLMEACYANTSPIYALYNSPDRFTSAVIEKNAGAAFLSAVDNDGAIHSISKICDKAIIDSIKDELRDKPIFIADGHHRYEVAMEFRKNKGHGPWDYVLMFLANMSDEGITVLPAHRLVRGIEPSEKALQKLASDFVVSSADDNDIGNILKNGGKGTFGFYAKDSGQWHVLKYKGDAVAGVDPVLSGLDVVILHEQIFNRSLSIEDIAYEMNLHEAVAMVNKGMFDGLFCLNPTGVRDVERVALSGLRMPPKSTYFYPKLLTGMVINKF
jgi:uncharacterized protein (DUF1015 family)